MPVVAEFANPLWLLALVPLAAFLVLARAPWWQAARQAGKVATRREARRLALRLAWLTLLVLTLAGLVIARPLDRQAIVLVLDASASTAPVRDEAEGIARAAAGQLREGDLLGLVATAAGARVEEAPTGEPVFNHLSAAVPELASDLATGLRLAGALIPEGYTGRVALVSDGRQTRGDALAATRELQARGISVDVLPVGSGDIPDVRLESLNLSETAYQGETATLLAMVYATNSAPATLRVYRDDELVREQQTLLRVGRQEIALAVPVG
ncbi:MAG: vWA domain-containing protein, partial [Chloroflexota bacterium]